MQVHCDEGVATRIGPKPCAGIREDVGEASAVRRRPGSPAEPWYKVTRPERQIDWERLKTIALSLGLPGVEETISWGQPTLKAHGKFWVWWSQHEDAPVFKVPLSSR